MRASAVLLSGLLSCLMANPAFAHSEHEKARFVSIQGIDEGRCDNQLRPCKTITYAVQQANKGDKVLVASGEYPISSSNELFYLKSLVVPIMGGYNRFDHFQTQSPDSNPTVLAGVPFDMAEQLRAKGFVVLTDGKALAQYAGLAQKLQSFYQLNQAQRQLTCDNGKAGNFECSNIDLLAHVPLADFSSRPSAANDIWGHVDLNTMREYALIGLRNGVAVVDVSEPVNPVEVGTVSGANSIWRDIKVYQYFDTSLNIWRAYAYATIDSTPDKVTIIDLNNLPHSVSLVEKNHAVSIAHNVFISNVDPSLNIALANMTPSLQLIGTNKFGGAFHNYSLTNPTTLTPLSSQASGQGYTHDGASMLITDERATACASKTAPCTVFIDFNEKEMKLWDISNPSAVSQLGMAEYFDVSKNFQYVHSGWPSENTRHIFLHDEFDEKDAGLNTTVRIFAIDDLTSPQQVGQWTGPTRAIDHNGFVRGNRYYMSNYERGLTVLDISNPAQPEQIGFFDTFTPSNLPNYSGAWGVYPYLPSGTILLSDIDSGLYILKDKTLTSTQGQLHFNTSTLNNVEQGSTVSISVARTHLAADASSTSVAYELIPGSAIAQQDYTPVAGTLTWENADSSSKTIDIAIATETEQEFEESFFVRLYNPTNGATLTAPSYLKINIEGLPDTGALSFAQSSITIAENAGTIEVAVSRVGSTQGSTTVNYTLTTDNTEQSAELGVDVELNSGQLTWLDGDSDNKIIQLHIIDDDLTEAAETFLVQLSSENGSRLGANQQLLVTISDDDANTAPQVELGENKQVNSSQTVTLTATVSDLEGDELSYQWSQSAGQTVTLTTPNEASTSFVAPSSSGSLTFSLTVTDIKGASNNDSITITVVAPKPQPTATSSSGGTISLLSLAFMLLLMRRKSR